MPCRWHWTFSVRQPAKPSHMFGVWCLVFGVEGRGTLPDCTATPIFQDSLPIRQLASSKHSIDPSLVYGWCFAGAWHLVKEMPCRWHRASSVRQPDGSCGWMVQVSCAQIALFIRQMECETTFCLVCVRLPLVKGGVLSWRSFFSPPGIRTRDTAFACGLARCDPRLIDLACVVTAFALCCSCLLPCAATAPRS